MIVAFFPIDEYRNSHAFSPPLGRGQSLGERPWGYLVEVLHRIREERRAVRRRDKRRRLRGIRAVAIGRGWIRQRALGQDSATPQGSLEQVSTARA